MTGSQKDDIEDGRDEVPESTSSDVIDYSSIIVKVELPSVLTFKPETVIGKDVSVSGEFKFERLLRIDGKFKGTLKNTGECVNVIT